MKHNFYWIFIITFFSLISVFASTPSVPDYLPVPAKLANVAKAEGKDFDKYDFEVEPYPHEKEITVEGRSMSFILGQLWGHSDAGDPVPVIEEFAQLLQQSGWKIICRCGTNPLIVTAQLLKSDKEVWLEVKMRTADSAEISIIEKSQPRVAVALDPPSEQLEKFSDQQDFPYLKHFPGSTLSKTVRYDEPLEVEVDSAPPEDRQKLVGSGYLQKNYSGAADLSAHEPYVVYRDALTKAGWEIVHTFEGTDRSLQAHFHSNGRELWSELHFWDGGRIEFRVADLNANQLEQQLESKGHVAIYGIYFDVDSAKLRPDSEPALQQILALLKETPKLTVEIQGHTDSTSTRAHNQVLSEQRAASVKQYLVDHGIDAARMTTRGFADTVPVADNKTESGRAKNRRVELAKQ